MSTPPSPQAPFPPLSDPTLQAHRGWLADRLRRDDLSLDLPEALILADQIWAYHTGNDLLARLRSRPDPALAAQLEEAVGDLARRLLALPAGGGAEWVLAASLLAATTPTALATRDEAHICEHLAQLVVCHARSLDLIAQAVPPEGGDGQG